MTGDRIRDDDSVRVATRHVLIGAAPDREAHTDGMWRDLDRDFRLRRMFMKASASSWMRVRTVMSVSTIAS